ncbi:MAG TPA: DUF881 domain-containing protein [Armatimonadota bacterium]|nr:DUF881 domain-containing protein [Armatimonadota bacterium]
MQRLSRSLPAALLAALFTLPVSALGAARQKADPPSVAELQQRLARAELLAGLAPVEGPGVVVTLRDSSRKPPRGSDRAALRVGEQDVNAMLNALRAAGAEAIAFVGASGEPERVLARTAIESDAKGLRVNGVAFSAPYRILAVGEPRALRSELFRAEGVVKRAALYTLEMIEVEESASLAIPAARRVEEFRFARPAAPVADARAPRDEEEPGGREERSRPAASEAPRRTVRTAEQSAPVRARKSPASSARGVVFGGREMEKYHYPGCRFGERIDPSARIWFHSLADAVKVGRVPCPVCTPTK